MELNDIAKKMNKVLEAWKHILVSREAMLSYVENSTKMTADEKETFIALWDRTAETCELETLNLTDCPCADCDCDDCDCEE